MELYNTHFYSIRALSNMQAGAGSTNSGKIDNLVQRDATDGLPCINDTSLKGALKEYAEFLYPKTTDAKRTEITNPFIKDVFGDDKKNKGNYIFQQAFLLSIPIRCSHKPFYRGTSLKILKELNERFELYDYSNTSLRGELQKFIHELEHEILGVESGKGLIFETDNTPTIIKYFEDFEMTSKYCNASVLTENVKKILGEDLVVFTETDFSRLVDDSHLPVIPRNRLDEQKNLWYEQVLPRETRLGFVMLQPKISTVDHFKQFKETFNNQNVIQIGANASVGYGWSQIEQITPISTSTTKQDESN